MSSLVTTDLMLVYDTSASTLKRCTVGNAASVVASNDLLLVERGGVKKKMTYANWRSSAQNTDLLLVETAGRGSGNGVKKKVTKANYDGLLHAGQDIYSAVYSPTLSFDYNSTSGDSLANWSVLSQQIKVTSSGSSSTGNLYIGVKITSSIQHQNDFCIASIQILQSNGSSFRADGGGGDYTAGYDWNFHRIDKYGVGSAGTNADGTNQVWGSTYVDSLGSSTSDIKDFSYSVIVDGSESTPWETTSARGGYNRNDRTTTAYVGADRGIHNVSTYSGGGGSILPEGDDNITQTDSTDPSAGDTDDSFYIYTETSDSSANGIVWSTNDFIWLESPRITVHNGDILRICYHPQGGQNSTNGMTNANTLHLWWDTP